MQSFTTEDLIQYMYGETSKEKTEAIRIAIESDWTLKEMFEVMTSAAGKLDTFTASPRQQTIDNILNYAEKAVEELTPHA